MSYVRHKEPSTVVLVYVASIKMKHRVLEGVVACYGMLVATMFSSIFIHISECGKVALVKKTIPSSLAKVSN